jgi:hypothetical protein
MGIGRYTDLSPRKSLLSGKRDLYEEDSGWETIKRLDRPRLVLAPGKAPSRKFPQQLGLFFDLRT